MIVSINSPEEARLGIIHTQQSLLCQGLVAEEMMRLCFDIPSPKQGWCKLWDGSIIGSENARSWSRGSDRGSLPSHTGALPSGERQSTHHTCAKRQLKGNSTPIEGAVVGSAGTGLHTDLAVHCPRQKPRTTRIRS